MWGSRDLVCQWPAVHKDFKINKDFLMRLLKRGDMSKSCIYRIPLSPDSCPTASGQRLQHKVIISLIPGSYSSLSLSSIFPSLSNHFSLSISGRRYTGYVARSCSFSPTHQPTKEKKRLILQSVVQRRGDMRARDISGT